MGHKNNKILEMKKRIKELQEKNETLKVYTEVLKECLIEEKIKLNSIQHNIEGVKVE